MQYSIVFVGALAAFATTTLAAPLNSRQVQVQTNDGEPVQDDAGQKGDVTILLQNQSTGTQTKLRNDGVKVAANDNGETISSITIQELGQGVPEDLRCQALGQDDKPLAARRNGNIDINFSKGEPWTFLLGDVDIKELVCDPSFKQITAEELAKGQETRVLLRTEKGAGEDDRDDNKAKKVLSVGFSAQGATTTFDIPAETREFATVEIQEGFLNDPQGLRCSVFNGETAIQAVRGENTDTTFGDGDKGEWTFLAAAAPVENENAAPAENAKEVTPTENLNAAAETTPLPTTGNTQDGNAQNGDDDMTKRNAQAEDVQQPEVIDQPAQAPSAITKIVCSPDFKKA